MSKQHSEIVKHIMDATRNQMVERFKHGSTPPDPKETAERAIIKFFGAKPTNKSK